MILAMAAVVTVVAAAVVCRYELAAAGSSSWKLEPAGGSGSARYWDSWNSSTAEAAVWRGHFLVPAAYTLPAVAATSCGGAAQLRQLCGVVTSCSYSLYLTSCGVVTSSDSFPGDSFPGDTFLTHKQQSS